MMITSFRVVHKDLPQRMGYTIPVYAVRTSVVYKTVGANSTAETELFYKNVTEFLMWTSRGWQWESCDNYVPARYEPEEVPK